MTVNDITAGELANLRTLVKIETFKSKKPITLDSIIARELKLAIQGKSQYISQKQKSDSVFLLTDTKDDEPEIQNHTPASTLGCVVKVETTLSNDFEYFTLVNDSSLVDTEKRIISVYSLLGSRLANAQIGELISHNEDFYQILDIVPQAHTV